MQRYGRSLECFQLDDMDICGHYLYRLVTMRLDPLYDEIEKVPEVIVSTTCKCSLLSF